MAGANPPKPSSHKPSSSSSSHRKTRWESNNAKPSTAANHPSPKPPSAAINNPSPKPSNNPNKDNSSSTPKPRTNPSPKTSDPTPSGPPFPFPDPPPPPAYGFHMLDRRTIVLADGSVRSYFALPPDYQDFTPPPRPVGPNGRLLPSGPELPGPGLGFDRGGRPDLRDRDDLYMRNRNQDYWNSLGLDGRGNGPLPGSLENSLKRKFGDEEREGRERIDRQRQQLLQYANMGLEIGPGTSGGYMGRGDEMRAPKYMRTGDNTGLKHNEVDQSALKKAFLNFVKVIYENVNQKKNYLADGKQGPLQCVACRFVICSFVMWTEESVYWTDMFVENRSSKIFPDMHGLVMHTYNSDTTDLNVDHLALHKALCVLMGWNYLKPPDNSKAYQLLSADEAIANQEDLIIWPPTVIIHNTGTGKGRDGRMEGLGNKAMDSKLRVLDVVPPRDIGQVGDRNSMPLSCTYRKCFATC
ncbi:unnamed protein product [Ilex paraguariensis]|uniref:XS domain-containing protein n=1 Tax=Ilex paraguariensis TaxID=185542 RepID=A0ABC8SB53_9AQUA